jgi:hypothetical protein
MSQDRDITVCAHVALWGMCRYLSQKYQMYREFLPFDIISLAAASEGRTFPYRGLTYSDYCKILSDFGCYPLIIRLKRSKEDQQSVEELKNLYSYVESGFPVLGSFSGHVATLIGHTIDYDKDITVKQDGTEDFIDSSFFLKQFIVIDDNFFPYQLLGYKMDPANYGEEFHNHYSIESIVNGICPLPEKVFLPAEKAREIGLSYYKKLKKQLAGVQPGPWVIRLFLTTNSSFKRRKIEMSRYGNGSIDSLCRFVSFLNMPHFIWVMELSTVDLYKKGSCLAEIVIDSTANERDPMVIYMRYGNTIILAESEKRFDDQREFFPQYTHNLGER